MPNLYARQTALPDISGRIDYISNPKRQEHLLATYDGAAALLDGQYWGTLAQECQLAFARHGNQEKKCCQGREIHGQLPNSLLEKMGPDSDRKNTRG